jgi:hypothetical protein
MEDKKELKTPKRIMDLKEEIEADLTPIKEESTNSVDVRAKVGGDYVNHSEEEGEGSVVPTPEEMASQLKRAIEDLEMKILDKLSEMDAVMEEENLDEDAISNMEKLLERYKRHMKIKKDTLEILERKMKVNQLVDSGEEVKPQRTSRIVVPSNMPKFRQNGPYNEPTEFLDAFTDVMRAHEIPVERYSKLLVLCLDSVDSQWIKNVVQSEWTWDRVNREFTSHFQHPNAIAIWQEKIRNLKMDNTGVQRYTDQFIRLAQRLRWDLNGEVAIYQYKQGLPD